ncbi:MAG TPA: glycosyltransferase family 4 protein [Flavisolibacter sp.]|nr:glycosyltransferase family 4 protein [Flavisolibacter sp.]
MKHVAILCSRLDLPGGIERAVTNTANLFAKKGHPVTLLILDQTSNSFYPIGNAINICQKDLDFGIVQKGNLLSKKLRFYRHVQELKGLLMQVKPDVIISSEYQFSVAAFFAARKLQIDVFAWEHHHYYWLQRSAFWQLLFKYVYRRLKGVVCLNPEEKRLHQDSGNQAFVVPNFITRQEKARPGAKTILTVGWFIQRKGIDLIPAIAETIFQLHPDWQWKLIGTGPEEESLRIEIEKRSLNQHIKIIAPTASDLSEHYQSASIYAMTSRFECFPMVLLEAMAHGVPCVSFDCPTGPSFIIDTEVNGLLVRTGQKEQMVKALLSLMANEEKRKAHGEQAYAMVEQWSPEVIYPKWKALFDS